MLLDRVSLIRSKTLRAGGASLEREEMLPEIIRLRSKLRSIAPYPAGWVGFENGQLNEWHCFLPRIRL